ncbi:g7813 [Coccomyxa elongata]
MLAWMGGARSKLKAKRKKGVCAGGVHKRAGAGIAANHKMLAPLQKKAAQLLQHSDPAEAERIDPSAVEPVDASSEVSQCDPEEDPFPVEELHSPTKEPTAQWQPYKKPKDIKSLDLDTILIPQPKSCRAATESGGRAKVD